MKLFTILQNILFILVITCFFSSDASAKLLKPGEIVYGRTQSETNGACTTAAIWAVGQDGANDRFITFGRHPRISPDGRKILFKRWQNVSCTSGFEGGFGWFIRDLATGVETQIGGQNGGATGAFFSPETNRAGLQITADEAGGMCQLNTGGGRTCYFTQIPPIQSFGHPSVRGGDFLIAAQNYDDFPVDVGGLYTMNYDRTNVQKIPNTTFIDFSPAWSNDGQWISYALFVNPCCRTAPYYFVNLFKIKPDGTSKTQLTNVTNLPPGSGFAYGLVWSHDNSIIYNAARLNNVTGIYKIDANGGGILGRVPVTPGQPVEWVGGIMPPFEEKEIAAWGGGVATSGNLTLVNTIGQAFAGQTSSAGNYNLQSGFWTYDRRRAPFDFDGDGKTDVSVFRPSVGTWFISNSSNGNLTAQSFGTASDQLAPADYDGDGKTDVAIYRGGNWFILQSSDNSFRAVSFGLISDKPQFGDFDGDGRADQAVFRPSNGVWYILRSTQGFAAYAFGISSDKPVAADYDGDGRADVAVYRDGVWYILGSQSGFIATAFGNATDKPVIGDYDGDGRSDTAIYRPSVGAWYFLRSSNNSFGTANFGIASDVPVSGDYDGDGKNDFAVFRRSENYWYILQSSNGAVRALFWGTNGDLPVPASVVP